MMCVQRCTLIAIRIAISVSLFAMRFGTAESRALIRSAAKSVSICRPHGTPGLTAAYPALTAGLDSAA